MRLADYFAGRELAERKVEELPWQLAEARAWQRLRDLLADLPFLAAAWSASEQEVKAYWARVETGSPWRMVDAYLPVRDDPVGHGDYAWPVAILLQTTGHPQEAFSLREHLVEHYHQDGDRANLQGALGNQALILKAQGDLDGAMRLHKEQERICRELGKVEGMAISLANQASLLSNKLNRPQEALPLAEESYRLATQHGLAALAGQIKPILDGIRAKLG